MTGKYLLLALLATAAFAQDPVSITPYQLIDARAGNAIACSNCSIYTYAAGTNTPLATYTSSTLATPNTNPVLTNSAGYAVNGATVTGIWVGSSCYKFVAKDSSAVTLFTQDNICDRGAVLKALLAGSGGAALVGYKLSATSSTATTVAAKLATIPDIKNDFGADSTGATDTTAAIQAALNYSAAASCPYAPPGTYKVTGLSMTGNMCAQSTGTGGTVGTADPGTATIIITANSTAAITMTKYGNKLTGIRIGKSAGGTGQRGIDIVGTVGYQAAINLIEDVFVFGNGLGDLFVDAVRIYGVNADAVNNDMNRLRTAWSTTGLRIEGNLTGSSAAGANGCTGCTFSGGSTVGILISHGAGNHFVSTTLDGLSTGIKLTNTATNNYGDVQNRGEATAIIADADATSAGNMFAYICGPAACGSRFVDASTLGGQNRFYTPVAYSYGLGADTNANPVGGWFSVNCGDYVPTYCASSTLSVFNDPSKASMFSGRLSSNSTEIDWDFQPFGTGYTQLLGVTNAANIVARFGTKNYTAFHDPEIWYSDVGDIAMAKTKWGYSNHGNIDSAGYYSICPSNAAGTPTCTIRFDGSNPSIQFAGTPSTWSSISNMLDPNSPYGVIGCAANTAGVLTPISNSNTGTFDATITGAGAFNGLAYCNGTNWKFR